MGTRIFVGNLSYASSEDSIRQHCEQMGIALRSARIILDRETGRSRGFAFVELEDESQLTQAVQELDGSMLEGRPLSVREAHDKPGPGGGGPPGPRGSFDRGPRPPFDRGAAGPAVESRRPPFERREGPPGPDARGPRPGGGPGFGGGGFGGGGFGGGPAGGGYGGGGGGYGGGGGGYAGGGGGGGGGGFGAPRPPGGNAFGKKKPNKGKDREAEGARSRFQDDKSRGRGFHGGRGYTEYDDDE